MRYSTGAVKRHAAGRCGGPDLLLTIPEAADFRFFYDVADYSVFSRRKDGNVWGFDVRDAGAGDLSRTAVTTSLISTSSPVTAAARIRRPRRARTSPWCAKTPAHRTSSPSAPSAAGDGTGNLQFAFIDASCPMDLVSSQNSWFPVFCGLHMAIYLNYQGVRK